MKTMKMLLLAASLSVIGTVAYADPADTQPSTNDARETNATVLPPTGPSETIEGRQAVTVVPAEEYRWRHYRRAPVNDAEEFVIERNAPSGGLQ